MTKRALITGILGQDGAYLAKLLLEKGYEVFGGVRGTGAMNNGWRLEELGILEQVRLVPLDLLEITNIARVIEQVKPDELYNLAAQSFVGNSFEQPILTSEINAIGAARILETMRMVCPECRFYQASTSEMFGKVRETPQTEHSPFHPRSPYGVSKLYAHCFVMNYREAYSLHASSGILFNHESPLRGLEFVTRKITHKLARVREGLEETIKLGNLEAVRDWGFAGDYVQGMWLMLQQPEGDDYLLASGEGHSVREFVERAADAVGFNIIWEGENERSTGIDRKTGRTIIQVDPEFYRPSEVDLLIGDPTKAKKILGWAPTMNFDQLVKTMVRADMDRVARKGK